MMGLRAFLVRLGLQSNKLSKWNRFSRGQVEGVSSCPGYIGKVKWGIETIFPFYRLQTQRSFGVQIINPPTLKK